MATAPRRLLLVLLSLWGCSRPVDAEQNRSLSTGECVEKYPRAFPRSAGFRSLALKGQKIAVEWRIRELAPEATPGYVLESTRYGLSSTLSDFVGAPSPVGRLELFITDEKEGKLSLDFGKAFGSESRSASDERSPSYREHFSVSQGLDTVAGIAIMHQSRTVSHWVLARGAGKKVHILRFRNGATYPLSRTGCEYFSTFDPIEEVAEIELPVDASFDEKIVRTK